MANVNSELRSKKAKLKAEWEECFDKKLEDVLAPENVNEFWDDDTTLAGAAGMLTALGIAMLIDDISDCVGGICIGVRKKNAHKSNSPYEVERVKDHYFYEDKFESEEAAKEFIKDICLESEHKMADFRVVKVCD